MLIVFIKFKSKVLLKLSIGLFVLVTAFLSLTSFATPTDKALNDAYEKALISFQENKIPTAIIHLKNALKIDNKHMPSRVLMVQIHIAQGNGIAAEVELDRARAGNVDNKRLVTLYGQAYLLQNRFDDAINIAQSGVRSNSIETELLLIKGQALIGKKQFSLADKVFAQALVLSPKNQIALLGRAQIALRKSKAALALSYIDKALSQATPFINGWILKSKIFHALDDKKQAMKAIDQALLIDSKHLSARLTKAMLHIEIQEYEQALPHIDYILTEIPNEPRAGYLKAIINASLPKNKSGNHKLTEVIATLAAVPAEVMKNTPDYYYLAGLTNYQFGNFNDARRYLTRYLSYIEYDIDSVRMIASIDLQQGEPNLARDLLTKTNLIHPNDPNILTLLGLTYLQLEENDKAQFYFERVLSSYPESAVGITNLARSKMQSGDYASAISALSEIKDNKINGVQIKLLLIDSYQNTKNYKDAIKTAQSLVQTFPEDSFFYQRLGMLYGLSGELVKARTSFEQALILDPNNVIAIVHLARMDNIAGQYDKALSYLQEKLIEHDKDILLMIEISDSYLFKKEIDNAIKWIKKAYAQSPNDFTTVKKLAFLLSMNNKVNEAIDIVDIYIGQNDTPEALITIAGLYQQQGKHQQAVLALRDYVSKVYDKSSALELLAKAQIKANDRFGAIQSYKKSIVNNNKNLSAHIGLVNLLIKEKNEEYALSLIVAIEKISKNTSLANVFRGDLYLSLGENKKAEKFYTLALAHAEQRQAVLGLYHSYKQQNEIKKAIAPLSSWLKKYPDDMLVAISLADSYKGSGQLEKSLKSYQVLIEKYGQVPILLNNIANVYFELGYTDKAKESGSKAHQYLPDNVAIIDTYAWIIQRLGDHETALALFRKALVKDFDNAEVKYHIAVTLNALSRRVEAKKYLIESVESSQNFNEKEIAVALLKEWSLG